MKHFILSLFRLLFLACILAGTYARSSAQIQRAKPVKILFLLDGSSSMLDDWQPGAPRFTVASEIINTIIDSIRNVNPDVEFALRVFGHQYTVQENNCLDTRLEVPYGRGNAERIKARLKFLSARGVSPIAYSLRRTAEENFPNSDQNAYSIILLTDGGESCGGDMCAEINYLLQHKISFKPYILSLIKDYNLEKDYDCFGKYLTVSQPNEITPAIKTIIDDNRIIFEKNDGSLKPKEEAIAVVPQPQPKPEPKPEPQPEPKSEPIVNRDRKPALYASKYTRVRALPTRKPQPVLAYKKPVKNTSKIVFTEDDAPATAVAQTAPVVTRNKITAIGITSAKLPPVKKIPIIWVFKEERPLKVKTTPTSLKFTEDEAPKEPSVTMAPKPINKPTKPIKQPTMNHSVSQDNAPVLVSTAPSADTKLLVYFTDGKGKYYKTEPKIDFVDVNTNKVVQSNYRFVNKQNGAPDPITIPPGTYRIVRSGSSFRSNVITIAPNTTSKVEVIVNKGSIAFRYTNNPNRPVSEFSANINNPVEIGGKVVHQRCDTLLEYEPGMYRVSINTMPPSERTLKDLKFGEMSIIEIDEPGTLIIDLSFRGRVQLLCRKGATFEPFHNMLLTGKPEDHQLDLLPGPYKIVYVREGRERILDFRIKSNEYTNLNL